MGEVFHNNTTKFTFVRLDYCRCFGRKERKSDFDEMSSAKEDLNSLTNEQLRARLLQHGIGNIPVTNSTRTVLLGKLRRTLEGQKPSSSNRRETVHVTKLHENDADEAKTASAPKKAGRRNTINATPTVQDEVVPIVAKPKNTRRSGRITPTQSDNAIAPIAIAPSERDIIELDEDSEREPYVPSKRTSRSPSLGKSQTVVTSYKTEVAKPIVIVESNEEDEYEDDDDGQGESDDGVVQNNIYPSLPTNGFKNLSPSKPTSIQSSLRRTTTHTTAYEPTSYKSYYEQNYRDTTFKAPQSKPSVVPTYLSLSSSSGVNRRYTASSFNSKQTYEDDSATEHSDIEAPYLSDFAKRLSQLRPEPLDRKIIADVRQHHVNDYNNSSSLWQWFSNLVHAFGRKFGKLMLAACVLMVVVFIYVFFIMP